MIINIINKPVINKVTYNLFILYLNLLQFYVILYSNIPYTHSFLFSWLWKGHFGIHFAVFNRIVALFSSYTLLYIVF